MNVSKTKTVMVNKAGEERNIAIDVDGQELEQVRHFRYLSQITTELMVDVTKKLKGG